MTTTPATTDCLLMTTRTTATITKTLTSIAGNTYQHRAEIRRLVPSVRWDAARKVWSTEATIDQTTIDALGALGLEVWQAPEIAGFWGMGRQVAGPSQVRVRDAAAEARVDAEIATLARREGVSISTAAAMYQGGER